MNKLVHKLQDLVTQPALNDREVFIELRPDENTENAEPIVSVSTVDFDSSNAVKINNYVAAGLTGGVGINEGMKYTLDVTDENSTLRIVDGLLALNAREVLFSKEFVKNVPVELRAKEDSVFKRSKNILWSTLKAKGKIDPEADYVQMPYEISDLPNYTEAALTTITNFVVAAKTREIRKEIQNVLGQILSILGAIGAILNLIVIILWAIVALAQIIVLITDVFDHLIQPVKYHATMRLKKLFEIGCKELNLDFESSIFDDPFYADSVECPRKFKSAKDANDQFKFGFTVPESTRTTGYPSGSFFEFFEKWKNIFRASITITDDGKFVFERITDPAQEPTFTLAPIQRTEWGTNQEDLDSNFQIFFESDLSETNTIDDYEGTITSAITSPRVIDDPKSVLLDGLKEVPFGIARASRKEELNDLQKVAAEIINEHEEAVNDILILANKVLNARNQIIGNLTKVIKKLKVVGIKITFNPPPVPPLRPVVKGELEERIGIMLLKSDFFMIDKVFSVDENKSDPRLTKIKTDNAEKWGSKFIYDNFHAGQGFVVSDEFPFGNQARTFTGTNVPICKEGIIQIINNKRIFTSDGLVAIVTYLKWFPKTGIAGKIEYKIQHIETRNLQLETTTPDGL